MQSGGGIQNGENVERVGTHREVEEQRTIMESKETEVEPFIPVNGAYKPQNHSVFACLQVSTQPSVTAQPQQLSQSWHKDLKISGQFDEPGQKDTLTFSHLAYQI